MSDQLEPAPTQTAEPNVQVPVSLIERLMIAASDFGVRDEEAVALAYAVKSEHAPLIPSFTPPRIEDMAPGTTFTAEGVGVSDTQHRFTVTDKVSSAGYRYLRCATHDGNGALASYVDPSTIRDVTPPRAD